MPNESPGIKDLLVAIEDARHYPKNFPNHGNPVIVMCGSPDRGIPMDLDSRLRVQSRILVKRRKEAQEEYSEDWREISSQYNRNQTSFCG